MIVAEQSVHEPSEGVGVGRKGTCDKSTSASLTTPTKTSSGVYNRDSSDVVGREVPGRSPLIVLVGSTVTACGVYIF